MADKVRSSLPSAHGLVPPARGHRMANKVRSSCLLCLPGVGWSLQLAVVLLRAAWGRRGVPGVSSSLLRLHISERGKNPPTLPLLLLRSLAPYPTCLPTAAAQPESVSLPRPPSRPRKQGLGSLEGSRRTLPSLAPPRRLLPPSRRPLPSPPIDHGSPVEVNLGPQPQGSAEAPRSDGGYESLLPPLLLLLLCRPSKEIPLEPGGVAMEQSEAAAAIWYGRTAIPRAPVPCWSLSTATENISYHKEKLASAIYLQVSSIRQVLIFVTRSCRKQREIVIRKYYSDNAVRSGVLLIPPTESTSCVVPPGKLPS